MLAVAAEIGVDDKEANLIIDRTIDVCGRFSEYAGDSIPEWMKHPIQRQLDLVRSEL